MQYFIFTYLVHFPPFWYVVPRKNLATLLPVRPDGRFIEKSGRTVLPAMFPAAMSHHAMDTVDSAPRFNYGRANRTLEQTHV
jgi:hypothetical protein